MTALDRSNTEAGLAISRLNRSAYRVRDCLKQGDGHSLDSALLGTRHLAICLASNRIPTTDMERELVEDLLRSLGRIKDLDRVRRGAIHSSRLGSSRNGQADIDHLRTLARERAVELNSARTAAASLVDFADATVRNLLEPSSPAEIDTIRPPDAAQRSTQQHLAGGAVRLVSAAVWLLPTAHRPRYAEEFRAELNALSDDGRSARIQLAYAFGLLVQAWSLRRGLSAPHPARGRSS